EPGCSFYLDLPALVPTAEQLKGPSSGPEMELYSLDRREKFAGHTPRVLVVDDNTLNRRLTTHLLQQLGAETAVAASAAECFEKLDTNIFDLVLMDVQMPVMDGLDATRHIRSKEKEKGGRAMPIVALTADAMVGDRERCMESGMDDYLTKPLRREELARVLTAYASTNGHS
ncbi:MAG: response regulator, partial [Chthoniobacterales bacterium]